MRTNSSTRKRPLLLSFNRLPSPSHHLTKSTASSTSEDVFRPVIQPSTTPTRMTFSQVTSGRSRPRLSNQVAQHAPPQTWTLASSGVRHQRLLAITHAEAGLNNGLLGCLGLSQKCAVSGEKRGLASAIALLV